MDTWKTAAWADSNKRILLQTIVDNIITTWNEIIYNSRLNAIIHAISLVLVVLIPSKEVIYIIDGRSRWGEAIPWIIAFFTIICEYIAIILTMPEARAAYLYPMLFASYLMILLYFVDKQQSA